MSQQPGFESHYDHLGGPLGEQLAQRLVALGWVSPEPNPGITPLGWSGLGGLGLDLGGLMTGRRKPVAFCEGPGHIGGSLGHLLRQQFLQAGWLEPSGERLLLTPAGEQALHSLGLTLEAEQ